MGALHLTVERSTGKIRVWVPGGTGHHLERRKGVTGLFSNIGHVTNPSHSVTLMSADGWGVFCERTPLGKNPWRRAGESCISALGTAPTSPTLHLCSRM